MDREQYGTSLPNELNRGGLGAVVRRAIQTARDQVDNSDSSMLQRTPSRRTSDH